MATDKKPVKGILKASSSFDKPDLHPLRRESKETKWDEMNILATHHPPGKDYGHMKIDEPPTPYSKYSDQEDDQDDEESSSRRGSVGESDKLDPDNLSSRLKGDNEPSVLRRHPSTGTESSSSEDETETEEERAKRKMFEQKRKLHYNEFQAVKLAKQLMEEEDDEEEDENDDDVKGDNAVSQDSSNTVQNNTDNQSDSSSQLQENVKTK